MRTIRLPHESGEGETVRRVVTHPHTGERVCIRGPRYLAQDNAYRQGAILDGTLEGWQARAKGWAGLYEEYDAETEQMLRTQ